jgi:PAS domain S-box-containing protein
LSRLSKENLAFYDGIAERIRELLQDARGETTIAALARRIVWNRSSLSNFLDRKTQTVPTHLLARTARALKVPVGYLMCGYDRSETETSANGTALQPRSDGLQSFWLKLTTSTEARKCRNNLAGLKMSKIDQPPQFSRETSLSGDGKADQMDKDPFRALADGAPALLHSAKADGFIDFANRGWLEYFGLPFEEVHGWEWAKRFHPDDVAEFLAKWRSAISHGEPFEAQGRVLRADGKYRTLLHRTIPVRDTRGKIIRWHGSSIDIEDLCTTKRDLSRGEFYLNEGQRLSHFGSWSFTPSGECDYWSSELYEILGFDPANGIPTIADYLSVIHPEDRSMVEATIRSMIADGIGCDVKKRIVRKDGALRIIRCVGFPLREDGKATRFIGTLIDITEQENLVEELHRREDSLRKSEEQWRAVFENTSVGIVLIDENIHFVSANEAYQKMVGYTESELQQMHPREYTHPEDVQASEAIYKDIHDNRRDSAYYEKRYRRRDGKVVWAECYATRLPSVGRSDALFVAVVVDITERKAAEAALRRREAYLATAQALSHTGSFGFNLTTGEIIWSEEMFRIYGCESSGFKPTLEWILRHIHPEDVDLVKRTIERMMREHINPDLEHRIITQDGSVKHLHVVSHILEDGTSKNLECVGSVVDVTEHHRARKAIEDAYDEIKKLKDELYRENVALKEELDQASMFEEIVGSSKTLKKVLEDVVKVAPTDSTVMITGETGTGKELVARAIHKRSRRAARAFVRVNCAAIAPSLIASELFGHEKGAFTGATQRREGRFEMAAGGTLFLDEVGELPEETQVALLRVLQEREFERVGGNKTLRSDVRVIAATNRDLEEAIKAGKFRRDLFYRFNVFPIAVPPLRNRRDDIPRLVEAFVREFSKSMAKNIGSIPQATMEALQRYDWPGNIRELRNVIERGMIISRGRSLEVELPMAVANAPEASKPGDSTETTLANVERRHILDVLEQTKWKLGGKGGAAERLGMNRTTLQGRMRKLSIHRPQ